MAKITSFSYANSLTPTIDNVQGFQITPAQMLAPMFLPSTFSFSIMLGIRDFDFQKDHDLRIEFKGVKGQTLLSTSMKFPPIPENNELIIPPEFKGFLTGMTMNNVVFETEGLYVSSIFFDDVNIGDFEIYVARKK